MSFMVWNQELETGVEIIDQQHRELVAMLNRAAPVLARSREESIEAVGPLLEGLLSYAGTHFSTEETMMERAGMDSRARDHHHASHADFGSQVGRMLQSFSQGLDVSGDQLLTFLASWLVLHILGEDQAMARQFRALEAGMPPQQAYVDARGDELHPSPAALSHALIGIYTIHTRENRELLLINDELQASRATIQHQNENLEQLVRQRTAELEQIAVDLRVARDAAEAGNRAKTVFLANMSHELRTPLNGVMGMIDLALLLATDPKQIDWLNKSKGAAQGMVKVVSDILDFSKAEAERLPLEQKNLSLTQLVDEAIAMQGITAEAKGLNLTREIPASLPDQLSGDAFRLRQILLNFLGNACKFSEKGTITVRVSAVEQDSDSVLARIEVEDQGIGISPEHQAMLFAAFTQVDGSMTRKYGGSGLGLIISKRLANLMGGDVGVASQEGRGSTFWATVRLRCAKVGEVEV